MSAPVTAELRSALERALHPSALEVIDDSAAHAGHAGARSGGHYRVSVVAAAFEGRTQLERHRLVYAAVAPLMSTTVHALNIDARTPAEAA
ncbi:MAG: BolA family transcriptional regulator [Proteobacteria bacterium]|nr:BolA family transcriptional regulator [Pseudomonadota bacterium]